MVDQAVKLVVLKEKLSHLLKKMEASIRVRGVPRVYKHTAVNVSKEFIK